MYEWTMVHKKFLEALKSTMKPFRNSQNRFGRAIILLAGDFSRITPADEPNAYLKCSILWKYVKILNLSKNMRVELQIDQSREIFYKQLIDIVY